MLVKSVQEKREYYDLNVKRRNGTILKGDHSFKVLTLNHPTGQLLDDFLF